MALKTTNDAHWDHAYLRGHRRCRRNATNGCRPNVESKDRRPRHPRATNLALFCVKSVVVGMVRSVGYPEKLAASQPYGITLNPEPEGNSL